MTAEAFLDEEQESAESFLDATDPAATPSAEAFLDTPEATPSAAPTYTDRPTGTLLLTPERPASRVDMTSPGGPPDPSLPPPAPIDMGAEQAATLARDATADAQARRGIFSPDSPPYRLLGDQYAIDPLRYDDAAAELWKEGLIDSGQYFRMMNEAEDIKTAATRRRELERQAGDFPELKSALYGLGKGGVQAATAIAAGTATGAATAPALGPGAIAAGIAAGVGTSLLAGDMYDTFAAKIAEEDQNIASLLAARELYPGYDTAGQFASVLIPAPAALLKLKNATSLIATERGAAEAAKFAARVTGTGAGIGAATDLAVQGIAAGADIAAGKPPEFSPESLGISTTLGALTAGLGVRSANKTYQPSELVALEQRAIRGTASPQEAADYAIMREAVATLRADEKLINADAVRRATVDVMGTRALDVTEIINPRFQRQALADAGFIPAPSQPALPYAAEPTAAPGPGTPAIYTGQSFLDRGGPAPTFAGGTTALPGPAGVPTLPGPLPAPPAVSEPPPTTSAGPAAASIAPEPTGSPGLIAGQGALPSAATPEPPPSQAVIEGVEPVWFPVDQIKISKDVPNFKEGADTQTGVVKGEQLQGKVNRIGLAPIQVWRRLSGDVEVISGRHRLDLHRRTGEKQIQVQIFNEADGFTKQDALTLDAELNIQDEKGTIKDYAAYFRNTNITEQQATERGLLSRQKGISGFAIGRGGSDDLYAAFAAGKLPESKAAAIALAAPGDADTQRIGLQYAPQLSAPELSSLIAVSRRAQAPGAKQGDLFGNSDANLNNAVALVKASRKRIAEIDDQILSVKGAVKRPEAARKMGVDINDPESIRLRMAELETLKEKYTRFYEHPAILREVRALAFGEEQMPLVPESEMPFNLTGEPLPAAQPAPPVDEEAARREAVRKAGQESTMSLFDAGPQPPAPRSKSSGSKSKADAGPAVAAPAPKRTLPPQETWTDAQIFADYPNAVAVHRGPGWAVPVILGGTDKVPVFQSPEIVEFYRTLAMQDPTLKNFNKALGRFYSDTGRVAVRPDLFLDENSALMTLSHEIGHFWSWADEGEIRLGNLGGHIQNIHNFLKATFPIERGGQVITPQERRKLYNQARKSMPKGSKPEKDDPGLGDWQMEVASRYRELVQELMESRRLAYVGPQRGGFEAGAYDPNIREELIGVSEWWKPIDYDAAPESYLKYRHSAAELFADAISVLFMSPADLKQRAPSFWEALFNHMDSRPEVKAKYLDIANRILRGREAVLDHRISRDMQNFAKADEIFMAIHDEAASRRASITGLRDDFLDQMWDQYYPITSALRAGQRQGKLTLAEDDPYRYLTEEHPMSDSIVQLAMADMGRLMARLDAAGIPRYELDMYLKDSRIAFEKQEIQAEVDGIMETVGWEGSATKAAPDGETPTTAADKLARQAELLGPEKTAILKATAAQWRDIFHDFVREAWKKGVLTDEAWQRFNSNDSYATFTVLKHIRDFATARIVGRKGTFQSVGRPTVEMMKKMVAIHRDAQRNEFRAVMIPRLRESLPDVVRDAPMKFNGKAMVPQEPQDRGWELIPWREKGQLRGVHIQTRWARAFQVNSPGIENAILRALNTGFRETIYNLIIRYNPSFQLGTGPIMDFTRSFRNMPGGVKGRVAFIKEMTREVFELAKSRDGRRILIEGVGSFGGVVTGGPAGAIVGGVGGVPGMALGGVLGANTAGAAGFYLGRMVANLVERALPWLPDNPAAALDWARGDFGRSAVIRDMVENYAISGPWNYVGRGMTADPDDSMGALFVKFAQAGKPESSNFLWKHLQNLFRDIEFAGQTLQLVPKTAAYRVMTGKMDMSKRESAYWIRNHIGLPNTAKKGSHIRNVEALLPFANVWARSLESMGKLLSGMDRRTMSAKEWWMAFILGGGGLYAVFQALASEGVFGEDIKKVYDGASEYVKSNLISIPLGTVPSPTGDKSALLTVPLDHESRLLFGLIYKTTRAGIRATKGQPLDVGPSDLVTGFAATTPGLNPLLDVGRNWMDFGMGKQPIDHRNLPILTEDERRVGGTAALKPMLGWTLEETGIANFFKWDPKANTFTEAALKPMPSINRFLRITDAGIREAERSTMDEEQRVRSQFKLGFPMWMQALRSEASYLQRKGDARNFREADRHMELRFWRRQYDKALEQMETAHELGNKSEVMAVRNQLIQDSQMFRPRD